jgi:hypothetical protein
VTDNFTAPEGLPATGEIGPRSDRPPRRGRWVALAALGLLVLAGLVWGLLWWRIAPTAATTVEDGAIFLNGHDELMAAQDGWFAILGGVAGALLSAVWPVLTRRTPVIGVVAGLVGSAAAGLLAWRIGTLLGPDPLKAQFLAGVKAPITPLVLHTPIAVLVAPLAFAVVRLAMEGLGHVLSRASDDRPGPATSSVAQAVDVQQGQ